MTDSAWTRSHSRYVATEMAIGSAITIVLSCAFAALLFGGSLPIAATDPRLQTDAAVQAFLISFMGSLVPTALARRRIRAGRIAAVSPPHRWPSTLFARSATIALLVAVPATLVHLAVVTCLEGLEFDLIGLLVFKSCFGVAVALLVSSAAVRLALRDRQTP